MRALSSSAGRLVLGVGFGAAFVILAPAACLFPSYTFTEPEPKGAGGSSSVGVPTSAQSGGGASPSADTSSGSGTDPTTSAGGNGGGGAPSSVSSSSGSNPGGENCGNGVDDNGDSKADCADPFCGTYGCVSEGPADWAGYYALYEGPAAEDPGCPSTFPIAEYTGNAGLSAPTPTCSACSCPAPTGQTCTIAKVSISNASCLTQQTGSACFFQPPVAVNGICDNSSPFPQMNTCGPPVGGTCPGGSQPCTASINISAPTLSGGSCAPTPQTGTVVPATWSTLGRACRQATPGSGCNSAQVCLGKLAAPYQKGICIKKVGINACPATFPTQHIYFDNVTDTRACSACQCSNPAGASCSTTVNFFSDAACGAPTASIAAGTCKDVTNNPGIFSRKTSNTAITPGSCTSSGGQVTGAATAVGPTTFCCK